MHIPNKSCNFAGGIGVPCERYMCRYGVIQAGVNKLNVLVYKGIADDVHKTCTAGASDIHRASIGYVRGVRNREEKFCYGKKETVFRQ